MAETGKKRAPTPARAVEERSAGGVVIRLIDGQEHVLLIRDPYHNWGLPKGHLEAGEGANDAALREVREETGLECELIGEALPTIDWYFRREGRLVHKFCDFYLMRSTGGETVPAADEGITECLWFPLRSAIRQITYDNARGVIEEAARVLDPEGGEDS